MATPWLLLKKKSDPWWRKIEKTVAAWLWNDLTRYQTRLPKPAKGYPDPDEGL